MKPKIRTTIRLPKDLHQQVKRESEKRDISLNDVLLEVLRTRYGRDVKRPRSHAQA